MNYSQNVSELFNTKEFKEKERSLTTLELKYWRLMKSRKGVLYLRGPVGTAKSAIPMSIAKKLGFWSHDLRLGSMDETDLGAFPKASIDAETGLEYVKTLAPKWALDANSQPNGAILIIEEINRTRKSVRDAALQILNERVVGNVKLNDNVFMISSGNLGEEDGTEVDDLEAAINNRLIHLRHEMTLQDWKEGYADKNVHESVLSFVTSQTKFLNEKPKKTGKTEDDSFGTFRSWSNLSDYVKINNLDLYDENDIMDVYVNAKCFIGAAGSLSFKTYLNNRTRITIMDVLNNYDSKLKEITTLNRTQKSDLLASLKESDKHILKLTDKQFTNAVKFMVTIDADEVAGLLFDITSQLKRGDDMRHPRITHLTTDHPIISFAFRKMQKMALAT